MLGKYQSCKSTNRMYLLLALLGFVWLFSACNPTKHVPEGKYLLDKYTINTTNKSVSPEDMRGLIRPRPNKRVLRARFHLGVYNLSNPNKNNGFNNWLRRIGEEPVIHDPLSGRRNRQQIYLYLRNKGYYESVIHDTVQFRKKLAHVTYTIDPGLPVRVVSTRYLAEDTTINRIVSADTANSLVKVGSLFDLDVLQAERSRLEILLRGKGYYFFSREYVYFEADTINLNRGVNLTIGIRDLVIRSVDNKEVSIPHQVYHVNEVFVYPDHDSRVYLGAGGGNQDLYQDTILRAGLYFIPRIKSPVRPRVIAQSIFIEPGKIFSLQGTEETRKHLTSLRVYKMVNIDYREAGVDSLGNNLLNCYIYLSPFTMQSFTIEAEGTHSSGNLGGAGNFTYEHKNFLGGAEVFDLRLKGALEALSGEKSLLNLTSTVEYGAEASITVPQFLLPIRSIGFVKKYNPRTSLGLAYNYQQRPDYTSTVLNFTFGYRWKTSRFVTQVFNPLDLNFVKVPYISEDQRSRIEGTYLQYSFEDHMAAVVSYSYLFNNQNIKRRGDFQYFRLNMESAGNLTQTIHRWSGEPKIDGYYQLFGVQYSQFVKGDVDYRFYQNLSEDQSIAYRLFLGIGFPYGNTNALPFEKKYYSGGPNSVRGWLVRSLGPGSYIDSAPPRYPNASGDIKLEANLEYRFSLFWIMEGALFLDAGNIWAINRADDRKGALFEWDRFYKEFALGTGLGFRFDLKFLIFRADIGVKLRDPKDPPNQRWVPVHRGWGRRDFALNFGIGYPF